MIVLSVVALLFALLAIGIPVSFAMAVSGALGLYAYGGVGILQGILKTSPLSTASSYEIITIPMFILMAEFVIASGTAKNLFDSAAVWVGRLRGGLAMATALAGAGFGAISGSSTASAATLAATSIPTMLNKGYDAKLAGGAVAISGTLAMLIPPSIALILYGVIADVSISKLLIAGVIPGLIVTVAIMLTVAVVVYFNPEAAPVGRAYTMREKIASLSEVGPMVVLFAVVTAVIYIGITTPTEASAIGAFGALVLAVWKRQLSLPTLWGCLLRAAQTTCMILLVILGAHIFGYFFALTRTTNNIVAVTALGFDPVWFGVIFVVTAEVGMVTPPMGMNAFVVSRYTGRPVAEIFQGSFPHILAHLIVIALLTVFPSIVLWLPNTM